MGHTITDLDELRRLRRARDRMDREYAQPLDVPALAHTALMSPAHFSRRFREVYSETPYSYLMTRRIERAKALLRRGDLGVTDVCFAAGWTSLGSFSARFTEVVGEEDGDAVAALLAKGEMYPVHFRTSDLTATFEKIAATPGVEVLQEPADQPWGVRDAAVRDPAGNRLRIEQA